LIGIALGILATIAWVKFRYGKVEIHLGLADAPRANSPQPGENDTPLNEQLN
jgi:hypothetical protein